MSKFDEYDLLDFKLLPEDGGITWAEISFLDPAREGMVPPSSRDRVEITGYRNLGRGALVYEALDGDPDDPDHRDEVLLHVAYDALHALHAWRRQMKVTGPRKLAVVGTVTYIHGTENASETEAQD